LGKKIAVEIKSFLSPSIVTDFHSALGQILAYQLGLSKKEPDRFLYLAITTDVYNAILENDLIQDLIKKYNINLLIFSYNKEIIQWIS
jgi:hypothetical protein